MRLHLAALALLFGLPGLAEAQTTPRLEPARDVAVTYRVVGAAGEVRLSWRAAGRLARFDNPDASWLVADLANARGFAVSDQQREVMLLPPPPTDLGPPGLVPPGARFAPAGQDQVAGLPCTAYRVELDGGVTGRACITAEGVVLRSVGSNGAGQPEQGLEATAVTFAAQDASRFQMPAGYRQVQAPPPGQQPAR